MPQRRTYEAIVIRAIDIGEADRLCVLFTREAGRKAARAKSVRKTASRLGGTLLPFRHIIAELSESENHSTITGAIDRADMPDAAESFEMFLHLQQGIELLLALTEDDEPIPTVFDLVLQFIRLSSSLNVLLPFQLRLLSLLGFMPSSDEDVRHTRLSETAKAYIQASTRIADLQVLHDLMPDAEELKQFMTVVAGEQLQRPLKSMNL